MFKKIFGFVLDFLFPRKCGVCNKLNDNFVCKDCLKRINSFKIYNFSEEGIWIYRYEGIVRNLIIDYKFKDKSYLCELFANCILSDGEVCKIIRKYDIILPVPLHEKRFKDRGYNQSKLISDILAQKLGVQTFDDVLVKIKNTLPQGKNLLHDRRKAIKGAFFVENPDKIRGKNVLIFDDIYTTGNTANECKKIIEESGAKSVEILTIAKDYILWNGGLNVCIMSCFIIIGFKYVSYYSLLYGLLNHKSGI